MNRLVIPVMDRLRTIRLAIAAISAYLLMVLAPALAFAPVSTGSLALSASDWGF